MSPKKPMSFQQKIAKQQSHRIYLLRGKEDGIRSCYFYLLIDALKVKEFEALPKGWKGDLTQFGKVLESGFGENPPEDIVKKMKEEYDYEE